jgi:hypothetical protein
MSMAFLAASRTSRFFVFQSRLKMGSRIGVPNPSLSLAPTVRRSIVASLTAHFDLPPPHVFHHWRDLG